MEELEKIEKLLESKADYEKDIERIKEIILSIKEKIKDTGKRKIVIRTTADRLLEIVEKTSNRVDVETLAKRLELPEGKIVKWVRILDKEGLLKVIQPKKPFEKISVEPLVAKRKRYPRIILTQINKKKYTLESYVIYVDKVPIYVSICKVYGEFAPVYEIELPTVGEATKAILSDIVEELPEVVELEAQEVLDIRRSAEVRRKFMTLVSDRILREFPEISDENRAILAGMLLHDVLGLDVIEILIADDALEEIIINGSLQPISVYHKKYGWLKTNAYVRDEELIYSYASQIGRKVRRQISLMNPIMDAHLPSGDRVNAILSPISTFGNVLSIRKFARNPWTIVQFIDPKLKTLSDEVAAFLWLCVQYELNILVAGGSASGKTSLLNTLCAFIPPNNHIVSIEEVRELNLPKYLHWNWTPLTSRAPGPEGKGEITIYDLLINSLRMRPDRIILGEVRRAEEARVLFEAAHTGHVVYSTMHADTAYQAYRRLINPPINIPEMEIASLHLVVVQYRDRKKGFRRTFEVSEVVTGEEVLEKPKLRLNILYRWRPRTDKIEKIGSSVRVFEEINMYTGMTEKEILSDLSEKRAILRWMLKNGIANVDAVGRVVYEYYEDPEGVVEIAKRNKSPKEIFG